MGSGPRRFQERRVASPEGVRRLEGRHKLAKEPSTPGLHQRWEENLLQCELGEVDAALRRRAPRGVNISVSLAASRDISAEPTGPAPAAARGRSQQRGLVAPRQGRAVAERLHHGERLGRRSSRGAGACRAQRGVRSSVGRTSASDDGEAFPLSGFGEAVVVADDAQLGWTIVGRYHGCGQL